MSARPELSKGFFQALLNDRVPYGTKPVLQVLESRQISKLQDPPPYRLRMSDSIHSFSGCGMVATLSGRFKDEGMEEANGIIRILDYNRNTNGAKVTMTITDYEIISMDYPVIGQPVALTTKSDDYTNIENFNLHQDKHNTSKRERVDDNQVPAGKRPAILGPLTDISLITPFINNRFNTLRAFRWRICGIVSNKENIREVNRKTGPLSVFSFVLTDGNGNSIKISAFGENAEKFNSIITNGQTYYISGGANSVRGSNKNYNSTNHDYELTLNRDSEIIVSTDVQISEPKFHLHPTPLNKINECLGTLIDVLAIVDRVADLTSVTKKDGTPLEKREIYLVDQSGVEVTLTLWEDKAREFDETNVGQVIGIKGCAVREFNGGFSLSPSRTSDIKFNPEGDATNQLYVWHKEKRPNETLRTMSSTSGDSNIAFERDLRLVGLVTHHRVGMNEERGIYLNFKAMIITIKTENAFYQACPSDNCRKKLVVENNQYRCDKCNRTYDTFKNVIMLSVEIADFSGTVWATIFEEKAQTLLGCTADQLAQLHKEDASQYEAVFEKIRFKEFNMRIRVKYEIYNDQQQMRWTILDLKPVPYDRCKKIFMETIQKCEALTI